MKPLPCPEGFRRARDADHALMISFLDAEFNRAQRGSEIRTDLPAFYCRTGVDPASKSYFGVNGCVSLAPNVRREEGGAVEWVQGSRQCLLCLRSTINGHPSGA